MQHLWVRDPHYHHPARLPTPRPPPASPRPSRPRRRYSCNICASCDDIGACCTDSSSACCTTTEVAVCRIDGRRRLTDASFWSAVAPEGNSSWCGDRDEFLGLDDAALEAGLSRAFCYTDGDTVGKAFADHARVALDLDGDGEVTCEEYTGPSAYDPATANVRPACSLSPSREAQFAHLSSVSASAKAGTAPRIACAAAAAVAAFLV